MPVSDWGAALHFYHKTGSRNGLFNLYSLQKKWGGGIVGTRFIRMNAKDVLFFVKSSSTLSWWNGNIRVHHSKATRCHVVTGSLYLEFAKILELLIAVFNVSFQLRYWFLTDCWLTVDWPTDWLLTIFGSNLQIWLFIEQKLSEQERRQLIIARLPNVRRLNGGGEITEQEREEAERNFIRRYHDRQIKSTRWKYFLNATYGQRLTKQNTSYIYINSRKSIFSFRW